VRKNLSQLETPDVVKELVVEAHRETAHARLLEQEEDYNAAAWHRGYATGLYRIACDLIGKQYVEELREELDYA